MTKSELIDFMHWLYDKQNMTTDMPNWKDFDSLDEEQIADLYFYEHPDREIIYKTKYARKTGDNSDELSFDGTSPRGKLPGKRERIFKLDGYVCLKCGESDTDQLSLDHVIPIAMGGSSNLGNLQTLCKACNSEKADTIVDYRHNRKGWNPNKAEVYSMKVEIFAHDLRQYHSIPEKVPMSLLNNERAIRHYGLTLDEINKEGGMRPQEIVRNITGDNNYQDIPVDVALERLKKILKHG